MGRRSKRSRRRERRRAGHTSRGAKPTPRPRPTAAAAKPAKAAVKSPGPSPEPPSEPAKPSKKLDTPPPVARRWPFWRGFGFAWLVPIPAIAGGAAAAVTTGSVPALASPLRAALLAVVFAGLPTAIGFGGVARVAYRDALLRERDRRVARRAALRGIPAGIGAAVLAAIPAGIVFEEPAKWLWIGAAGALVGVLGGAALGAWVRHWTTTAAHSPHGDEPNVL